ncbi:ABC transporter permease [Schumannella luteola]|uniref:Spermidine/putrescine transport system permease protein n=1 Tax=Schumannella luteola TaxID=472059 RepID=A0A852Y9P3_9MICO|nr:ABC transporter permease [Schumannella luteola]NYG97931.1 spermidine/putrescine transport system permease protein [Schumannella luteola]TPX03067.1 ABC transporter permease [Schumannella luteola]
MSRTRRDNLAGALMMVPASIVILVLVIVPMAIIARDSFAVSDPLGGNLGGFTLENYAKLLDPVYAKTMGYSLGMAVLNAVVCTVVGYIVAYYIATRPARRQPLLLLLVIIPFLTDFLVRTFSWITLLGSGGPIIGLAKAVGIPATSLVPSQTAVVLSLLYAFLPVAVFPIYASMRAIDPSLREAAADLGAGWWQTHARVYVPLSASGLASSVMLTFVPTLGVFVIPVLLGGGKDPLVGNLIVTLFTEFRNEPLGAALSMVVLVLMLVTVALAGIVTRVVTKKRSA